MLNYFGFSDPIAKRKFTEKIEYPERIIRYREACKVCEYSLGYLQKKIRKSSYRSEKKRQTKCSGIIISSPGLIDPFRQEKDR